MDFLREAFITVAAAMIRRDGARQALVIFADALATTRNDKMEFHHMQAADRLKEKIIGVVNTP